jgi:hypothetical protein
MFIIRAFLCQKIEDLWQACSLCPWGRALSIWAFATYVHNWCTFLIAATPKNPTINFSWMENSESHFMISHDIFPLIVFMLHMYLLMWLHMYYISDHLYQYRWKLPSRKDAYLANDDWANDDWADLTRTWYRFPSGKTEEGRAQKLAKGHHGKLWWSMGWTLCAIFWRRRRYSVRFTFPEVSGDTRVQTLKNQLRHLGGWPVTSVVTILH